MSNPKEEVSRIPENVYIGGIDLKEEVRLGYPENQRPDSWTDTTLDQAGPPFVYMLKLNMKEK